MTKYNQKIPNESVNYTKEHPLKDFIAMGIGLVFLFAVVFITLNYFVGIAIGHVNFEQESKWFGSLNSRITENLLNDKFNSGVKATVKERELHDLLEKLWLPFGYEQKVELKVELLNKSELNAFTGLGGQFYFTSGLIKSSRSLNGLAFVACHELGHFYHRHVLRGSGRKLLLSLILRLIGLGDSLIGAGSEVISLKFSREDEKSADSFALDCQQKFFGHVNGFDEFFINSLKQEGPSASFLSSHPKTQLRIEEMKIQSIEKGYSLEGELTVLPDSLIFN